MIYKKYERLKERLASYQKMVIAFSGGVDSSFLLKVAHDVLQENAKALFISTPYIAHWEMEDALSIAREIGAPCEVIEKAWLDALRTNPQNRCYVCKHSLFSALLDSASQQGFFIVADGSNVDDLKEYRPGRVALQELHIQSPLVEAELTKSEIRQLSKELGLSTWDKPSYACLLTRFPYEKTISEKALEMVSLAEAYLIDEGYSDMRVRYDNAVARIEMPFTCKTHFIHDVRLDAICAHFKSLGFLHVTLDLEAYRHDSLNESKQKV